VIVADNFHPSTFVQALRFIGANVDLLATKALEQIELSAAALGLALATGVGAEEAVFALGQLTGAPGRLQHVASHPNGAPIYVDYAHKPDALETVLHALRPQCRGKLSVVFGCGGERDTAKRPMMGAIAARLADRVIVTDDNPRGEDSGAIRRAILDAAPGAREIADRAEAIATAIRELEMRDLLVIAGKGHERGQYAGTSVIPFDDREVAAGALARRRPGARGEGAA